MHELASRERLQPSLLDRLTDNAPDQRRETFEQQTLSMQQLRQAVLRDLAWLLNTTNLAATEDLSAAPLAAKSTINFGVPGFAGMISTGGRSSTRWRPASPTRSAPSSRASGPRLLKVRLRRRTRTRPTPALVFEIQGELWAQPVPQQLFPGNADRAGNAARGGHRRQDARLMDPRLLRHLRSRAGLRPRGRAANSPASSRRSPARLSLGSFDVADPYVERLLEGFALLDRPHPAQAGSGIPDLHAVAAADGLSALSGADPVDGRGAVPPEQTLRGMPQGVVLPAGTELRSLLGTEDQTNCEFRTAARRAAPADRARRRPNTSPPRPRSRRSACRSSAA